MILIYLPSLHRILLAVSNEMIGVLGHDSTLCGYTGLGTAWANEMNFVTNHAAGAGSIA